jgi:hypothetical protein
MAAANGVILPQARGVSESTMMLVVSLVLGATMCAIAAYVAAGLAQQRPIAHAVAVGGLKAGLILVLLLAAPADWSAAPLWYHVVDALIALPAAWFGGRLFQTRRIPALRSV